ncbi:MAG TPA: KGG domain-containing protein [Vicinamibacterales bacterium]
MSVLVISHVHGGLVVHTGERKERRGFASMSPEKQREIASKGGRAAHEKGTAHEWTADEARNAGRKGGQVSRGGRGRLVAPQPENIGTPPVANDASSTPFRTE